jgi:hypothetical protein
MARRFGAVTIDPAVSLILRCAFVVLFASSAVHKLRDFGRFCDAVADYQLMPPALVIPTAVALALLELVSVVIFLVAPSTTLQLLPAGLLLLYAFSIAINLQRGRRSIDCGCLGVAGRVAIHRGLVARNVVLAGLVVVSALPSSERLLTWIDGVSISAGVFVVAAVYIAVDGLLGAPWRRPMARIQNA